jgi:hypothetical protein
MKPFAARFLPLLILGVLLAGCSGIRVDSDYDPSADFAALRSYAWLPSRREPPADPRLDSSLLTTRIERAIDSSMRAKGFTKVAAEEADFFVTFHIGIDQKVDVTTIPSTYGYYGRWGGYYGGTETRVDQYEEGTLLIDFIDRGEENLLWRGSGQSRISEHRSPEDREKRVREVVEAILGKFPPQP